MALVAAAILEAAAEAAADGVLLVLHLDKVLVEVPLDLHSGAAALVVMVVLVAVAASVVMTGHLQRDVVVLMEAVEVPEIHILMHQMVAIIEIVQVVLDVHQMVDVRKMGQHVTIHVLSANLVENYSLEEEQELITNTALLEVLAAAVDQAKADGAFADAEDKHKLTLVAVVLLVVVVLVL